MEGANQGENNPTQAGKVPRRKIKLIPLLVCLLILSFAFNIFLLVNNLNLSGASFKYIEPTSKEPIDKNVQDESVILHYDGLRNILEKEVTRYSSLENVGIFVQDVRMGGWSGINERKGFSPASLIKIPIMMAILKKVDRGEISLRGKVKIIEEDIDSNSGNVYKKGAGVEYSVKELLEEMITYSDNTAKNALKRHLSIFEVDSVFKHVGIPNPYLGTNGQTVSPRDYTRLFKALYYSTYISPELSELAIDLTTDTSQEDLISMGVPHEIQVAHKFGIYHTTMLHDCGIVYHQENPYFLCVMTKDIEIADSQKLIQAISKDVYEFVESKSSV